MGYAKAPSAMADPKFIAYTDMGSLDVMCSANLSTKSFLLGIHAVTGIVAVAGVLAVKFSVVVKPLAEFSIVTVVLVRDETVISQPGEPKRLGTKLT